MNHFYLAIVPLCETTADAPPNFSVTKPALPLLALLAALTLSANARENLPSFDSEVLARAVAEKPPRWKFVRGTRYRELPETFAMQLVANAAALHPDHRIGDTTLAASLATKIQYFLRNDGPDADGNTREPEAQGGIGGWSHNAAAWALLIAKQTPDVWTLLTADRRRALHSRRRQRLSCAPRWDHVVSQELEPKSHRRLRRRDDRRLLLFWCR